MCMDRTFGPFLKDKIIDASFMSHYFYPNNFITKWTQCTNKYAKDNCDKTKLREVKEHHILQFLAIHYYMGVARLPAKRDYWKQGGMWPAHPVTWGMSCCMFEFLFKHFHVFYDGDSSSDDFIDGNDHDSNFDDDDDDDDSDGDNDGNNNNNNDSNDSGNDGEGEEGDANDVDDHPDVYNCALEEFAQNPITNKDKDVEV